MPRRRDNTAILVSDRQRIAPGSTVSTFAIDFDSVSPSVVQERPVIDDIYESALNALVEERDRGLRPLDRRALNLLARLKTDGLTTSNRKDRLADLQRTQREQVKIAACCWRAIETAYFECRLRHWNRIQHGRGRPPKEFHWFRTVPTGGDRTAQIVERVRVGVTEPESRGRDRRTRDAFVDVLWEDILPGSADHRRLLAALDSHQETSRSIRSATLAELPVLPLPEMQERPGEDG